MSVVSVKYLKNLNIQYIKLIKTGLNKNLYLYVKALLLVLSKWRIVEKQDVSLKTPHIF